MSAFHFKALESQPAATDSIELRVPGTATPITGAITTVAGGALANPFLVSAAGGEGDWAFIAPFDVPYDVYWVEGAQVIGKSQVEPDAEKIAAYPYLPEVPSGDYLADDGTFKPVAVSGGNIVTNLYLSNDDSAVSGYKKLKYALDAEEVIKEIVANAGTVQGEKYLFDAPINITEIGFGAWVKSFTRKVSSAVGVSTFSIRMFMYTVEEVENTLFTLDSTEIDDLDFVKTKTESSELAYSCNATDRFGIQISFTTTRNGDVTLSYKIGDGDAAYLLLPLALRHSLLRSPNEDPEVQHMTSVGKIKLDGITYNVGNPAVNTNPSSKSVLWINTTSGEIFTCTDITAGANVWIGQLGSVI